MELPQWQPSSYSRRNRGCAAALSVGVPLYSLAGVRCHAAVAFQLLLSHCRCCSCFVAKACGLQLTAANPCPVTNAMAMGALHEHRSLRDAASVATVVVVQLLRQLSCHCATALQPLLVHRKCNCHHFATVGARPLATATPHTATNQGAMDSQHWQPSY